MSKNVSWSLCGIFVLLVLISCSSHTLSLDRLGQMSRDDFMSAMRWKQYKVAANLMVPEHRKKFLDKFTALRDIHITDVRLVSMESFAEGRRFDANIEMDYYLFPSVTVKTFSFEQTWVFHDGENKERRGFLIVTPFPDFP